MSNRTSGGPRRVLLLDRNPDNPRWIIATIVDRTDERPATLDQAGRYTDWVEITDWVRRHTGHEVGLVPVHDALAWHVHEVEQ